MAEQAGGSSQQDEPAKLASGALPEPTIRSSVPEPQLQTQETKKSGTAANDFRPSKLSKARSWIINKEQKAGLHDYLMVAFTCVLTVVAILQGILAYQNSQSSTEQLTKIITVADRIEDAADSFSGSATHINDGVNGAVKQLGIQADKLESARNLSRREFDQDQRPYLWLLPGGDKGQPNLRYGYGPDSIGMTMWYQNYGRSPAIITGYQMTVELPPDACQKLRSGGMISLAGIVPTGKIDSAEIRVLHAKDPTVINLISNGYLGMAGLLRLRYQDQAGHRYETDVAITIAEKGQVTPCPAELGLTKLIDCERDKCKD